jgi:hypothetical protein
LALKVRIVKNPVGIVVIGSLVIFASIMILIYVSTPTPPPPIAYTQMLQSAGLIIAVSGTLVFVLERRVVHPRLKKSENGLGP